jgi:hypothetical protein
MATNLLTKRTETFGAEHADTLKAREALIAIDYPEDSPG